MSATPALPGQACALARAARSTTTIYRPHPALIGPLLRIVLQAIEDRLKAQRILDYLGEPASPAPISPARGPPRWEDFDPPQGAAPVLSDTPPEYELDQRVSWQAPSQFLLFLPVAAPRPPPVYSRPGTGYPELTPEPPQTTGAAPPLRFRTGADRFQTAQSPPGPPDEPVPVANPH